MTKPKERAVIIKLRTHYASPEFAAPLGTVVKFPAAKGQALIKAGYADKATRAEIKDATVKVFPGVVPVERAVEPEEDIETAVEGE